MHPDDVDSNSTGSIVAGSEGHTRGKGAMNIGQALDNRIPRICKVHWANPDAYLRLPLLPDGMHGPWAELYDDKTQIEVMDVRPGSQRLCLILPDALGADGYEEYTGPVSEYEKAAENYARSYMEE